MLAPGRLHVPETGLRPASLGAIQALPGAGRRGRLQRQSCRRLNREDVIDQELQAALALVLVHIEAIHQVNGPHGRAEALRFFDVIEGDRVESATCLWDFDPHFQVALSDDAGIADGEDAIETRLRESLAPGAAGTQGMRG